MKKSVTLLSTCALLLSCSKDEEKGTLINSNVGSLTTNVGSNAAVTNSNKETFLAHFEEALSQSLMSNELLPGNHIEGFTENQILDTTITFKGLSGSYDCTINGRVTFDTDEEKAYIEEANLIYTFYNYQAQGTELFLGGQQGINLKIESSDLGKNNYTLQGNITGAYRFNGLYASENGEYGVLSYSADPIDFIRTAETIFRSSGEVTGDINSDLTYTLK